MTPATSHPSSAARQRLRVHVRGVVQGVGFRPFVHRLAMRHALSGWVRNESGDVVMELDGEAASVDRFLANLRSEAPPLARIDGLETVALPSRADAEFRILDSEIQPGRRQPVPADVALCDACLRELYDPTDRRFEYPFITCTDCGPRYTVIESVPYDRERTTMRAFAQCPTCRQEYETPGNRRYHSETNSCPDCGPRLWIHLAGTGPADHLPKALHGERSPLDVAGSFLRCGAIVAIRGLGGFHLAVDAMNDAAVTRLRDRKQRDAKPFAVMVRSLEDARAIAQLSRDDESALCDRERPIVLLRRRPEGRLAIAVAPGLDTVGVMLAYTPLHHLLLDRARRPLVMTSGNRSEEPIAASVEDGVRRLDHIADLFLLHNRDIVAPVDDSVVRVAPDHGRQILRRARGMAPLSMPLGASAMAPVLAVGGQLKNTFTLAVDEWAYVSPHLGDLDSAETMSHFLATLQRYEQLFVVEPEVVAHDLHPTYLSTRAAFELARQRGLPLVGVQHHHAHIAAVLGEHACDERVIGVAFDGTGFGPDGTVWGAELLLADRGDYERVGHLRPAPLPGGDLAVRSPWRSALGYLSLEPSAATAFANAFERVPAQEQAVARRQIERRVNTPLASSMGRLFDAAAAVLGVCTYSRYEGEAAMRLESLAGARRARGFPFPREAAGKSSLVLDPVPLLVALGEKARQGQNIEDLAAAFHETVADGTARSVQAIASERAVRTVVLGGGVFQNARLLVSLRCRLEAAGLRVLLPLNLPMNDGAISYGQAVVAVARLT